MVGLDRTWLLISGNTQKKCLKKAENGRMMTMTMMVMMIQNQMGLPFESFYCLLLYIYTLNTKGMSICNKYINMNQIIVLPAQLSLPCS